MQRSKMTNSAVEKFVCREGRDQDTLWCGETRGFGMKLSRKTGTRTYFLLYRVKGTKQERYINIGRHNDPWRVDQARAKALELKSAMLNGVDPVIEAQRKREENARQAVVDAAHGATLRQIMEHYLEHKRTKHGPLRPKTKASIRDTIERYLPAWLDKSMADTVTREACFERFTEMSDTEVSRTGKKGKKGSANLTFVYLRALCNHARVQYENENGEPTVFAANPVTRMFKLRKPNPEKARTGRIPRDRIGHVWVMLQSRRAETRTDVERTAADWVCKMLITGSRLTESGSLKRADVNLAAKTFTLRGDVVKNHNGVTLPMSTVLHEILLGRLAPEPDTAAVRRRHVPRSSEYVFPSFGKKTPHISDARATMQAVSKVAGVHVTPHDLRRTYEDILKFAKVDPDERRQLLNHLAEDVHGAHYSNDEDPETLRPAVEAAAQWVLAQARVAEAQISGANVIAFPGKPA